MMYKALASGGRGTEILRTDNFAAAVTAAYGGYGWVTDDDGNEIPITDENGEALYPEYLPEEEG